MYLSKYSELSRTMVRDYKQQVINSFFTEVFCERGGMDRKHEFKQNRYIVDKHEHLIKRALKMDSKWQKLYDEIEKTSVEKLPAPDLIKELGIPFSI